MSLDEFMKHMQGVEWFLTAEGQIRTMYEGCQTCPICYVGFKLNRNPWGYNSAFSLVSMKLGLSNRDTVMIVCTADERNTYGDALYSHELREKMLSLLTLSKTSP